MVFFNVLVFLPIFSTNQRTPRKYSVVAIMNILQKKMEHSEGQKCQ